MDSAGSLTPSSHAVGKGDPAQLKLKAGLKPAPTRTRSPVKPPGSESFRAPKKGTIKNLVLPFVFSNHQSLPRPSKAQISVLYNSPTKDSFLAPTGSVRAFYLENSYNQLTMNSVVMDYLLAPYTEAYYAGPGDTDGDVVKLSSLFRSILTYWDNNGVDFRAYDLDGDKFIDAVDFLHSGYGAEIGGVNGRIWSHQSVMSPPWVSKTGVRVGMYHIEPVLQGDGSGAARIVPIGVICHETNCV